MLWVRWFSGCGIAASLLAASVTENGRTSDEPKPVEGAAAAESFESPAAANVQIRLDAVELGVVYARFADATREGPVLIAAITIENVSTDKTLTFDNRLEYGAPVDSTAYLTDNFENYYPAVTLIEEGDRGDAPYYAVLAPGEVLHTQLAFEAPSRCADYLTLCLPAHTVAAQLPIRLEFSSDRIVSRQ